MKRWFAIALSVGFATAVANMPWLKDDAPFAWPFTLDSAQAEQVVRLTVAAIATLLSWDGYFKSVCNKPVFDGPRFSIDVFLVFLYLLLLLTSKFPYFWLAIHAGAFLLYICWDFLSIRLYRSEYVNSPPASLGFNPSVWEVYKGSISDDPRFYRGPAVTLMWPLYFFALPLSYWFVLSPLNRSGLLTTGVYGVFVLWGLFWYRHDKKAHFRFWPRLLFLMGSVSAVLCADLILSCVR